MPELPEVETMRRGVSPIIGGVITEVDLPPCQRKPILVSPGLAAFRRRAKGKQIEAVDRVGKRVVVCLEGGGRILFEPRMTGLVLTVDPPSVEHLRFRLAIQNSTATELLYWDRRGLGSVRLMNPQEFSQRFGPTQIGPDALVVTADHLQSRLGKSRREIKPALLDQKVVAGVGNIYASELLHLAGVNPTKRCDLISGETWKVIQQRLLEVMLLAIAAEGSTLSDGAYRTALNNPGQYQNHHRVYARQGQPCFGCTSSIQRIVQTQRATFFCPVCQPKSRR